MNNIDNSTYERIQRVIDAAPMGKIFFLDDFAQCGSYTSIRSQMVRFEQKKTLIRVARGIYIRAVDIGKYSETQLVDWILESFCSHYNLLAYPTGEYLLYKSGFINELPNSIELVYKHSYPRKINILDKYHVLIKHHSLDWLDKINSKIVQWLLIFCQTRWKKTYPVTKESALQRLSKQITKEEFDYYRDLVPDKVVSKIYNICF